MSAPDEPGSWRAVEVGPGGVPAERITPRGPGAPPPLRPVVQPWHYPVPPLHAAGSPWDAPRPGDALWQKWSQPHERDRPRSIVRRSLTRIVGMVAVFALVIGLALWGNASRPLGAASRVSQIGVGDCLQAGGQRISGKVGCAGDGADFSVVGRYAGTSDASDCSATPSDVAVVAAGPAVLCLDYIAAVGDCLLAGDQATGVGKVACSSDLSGVYRVESVLHNTIDPADCPGSTRLTLIHRFNSEVLCLGHSA